MEDGTWKMDGGEMEEGRWNMEDMSEISFCSYVRFLQEMESGEGGKGPCNWDQLLLHLC